MADYIEEAEVCIPADAVPPRLTAIMMAGDEPHPALFAKSLPWLNLKGARKEMNGRVVCLDFSGEDELDDDTWYGKLKAMPNEDVEMLKEVFGEEAGVRVRVYLDADNTISFSAGDMSPALRFRMEKQKRAQSIATDVKEFTAFRKHLRGK